jgi:hypothetical protein
MNGRPKFEPIPITRCSQRVGKVHRILPVRHQDAFLDGDTEHVVAPVRHLILQSKFEQIGRRRFFARFARLAAAKLHHAAIGEAQPFFEVVEHQGAAVRRRQCRDQQPMVTPCHGARDRAGGVAAQSIRHEPLPMQQLGALFRRGGREINSSHKVWQ